MRHTVLASQYRSHSVPLVNAAHCPGWFLSMGSRRLHRMQKGSGRIHTRWRCVPKQSCPAHNRNSLVLAVNFILISCLSDVRYTEIPYLSQFTVHSTCYKIPPSTSTHFQLVCEIACCSSELILMFRYACSRIQNVSEQFVSCIHLSLLYFAVFPT
jgi:hypothetical protein